MEHNYTAHALRDEHNPRKLRLVGSARVEGRNIVLALDDEGIVWVLNRNSSIDMLAPWGSNPNLRRLYCRLSGADPTEISRLRRQRAEREKAADAARQLAALKRQAAKHGYGLRRVPVKRP